MTQKTPEDVLRLIQDESVDVVDIRFIDLPGTTQHFSIPARQLTLDIFQEGLGFDGSSIRGFQEIHESDMILLPRTADTAVIDPFRQHKTLNINCFVHDPVSLEPLLHDPRYVAKKDEGRLRSTGLADTCYFGPEAEFFIFDSVRYGTEAQKAYYEVDSREGHWNSGLAGQNLGYTIRPKLGYFPTPPTDHFQDLRSEMILTMERMGIEIEVQHHEVTTAGQAEIDMRFDTLLSMADKLILYKYIVKSVAAAAGLTATFMPKPLFEDNGSGMHCHQSLWKGGDPLFYGDGYGGLSDMGRWYVGGLLTHAPAILAFAAPTTNFVQASGARLRGAREPRVLPEEPLGGLPDPALLPEPEGQADRVPLPGPVVQPLPRLLGHDARGPGRGPEQIELRRRRSRSTSSKLKPGRARRHRAHARLARRGARCARAGQRVPPGGRGLHRRPDRHLDRVQAARGGGPGATAPAPLRVPALLRHLIDQPALRGSGDRRQSRNMSHLRRVEVAPTASASWAGLPA